MTRGIKIALLCVIIGLCVGFGLAVSGLYTNQAEIEGSAASVRESFQDLANSYHNRSTALAFYAAGLEDGGELARWAFGADSKEDFEIKMDGQPVQDLKVAAKTLMEDKP